MRIAVDEMLGELGLSRAEMQDVIGLIGELPDLWDFCMGTWPHDSQSSRFAEEGFQEKFVRGLKELTSKPVVGVGRFTSADAMVRQIRSGVMDFVGAARPSIADPFLPQKNRGRPHRGHSRVYRLQHMRHRRLSDESKPMHAECNFRR